MPGQTPSGEVEAREGGGPTPVGVRVLVLGSGFRVRVGLVYCSGSLFRVGVGKLGRVGALL